jgi:hypothetical protein
MSLEHSPSRKGAGYSTRVPPDRADAYTVDEFCDLNRISRVKFYALLREGRGPRLMRVDSKIRISKEAAADWRRASEAAG